MISKDAKLVFNLDVPKTLALSDWSLDVLSREQLAYAALDAVLATALWHAQRGCFESDNPEAEIAQHVADDVIKAVARAELSGVGFDRAAHVKRPKHGRANSQRQRKPALPLCPA